MIGRKKFRTALTTSRDLSHNKRLIKGLNYSIRGREQPATFAFEVYRIYKPLYIQRAGRRLSRNGLTLLARNNHSP